MPLSDSGIQARSCDETALVRHFSLLPSCELVDTRSPCARHVAMRSYGPSVSVHPHPKPNTAMSAFVRSLWMGSGESLYASSIRERVFSSVDTLVWHERIFFNGRKGSCADTITWLLLLLLLCCCCSC